MSGTQLTAWRRMRYSIVVWSIFLGAQASIASAQTFTGTVTNATTQKPAAGDEVVLLDVSGGLREVARTRSDSNGSFTFNLGNTEQPRMLRVIHQGASYYKVAERVRVQSNWRYTTYRRSLKVLLSQPTSYASR